MKLLDPRTINTNLTSQRKVDIDQGLSLARKIDTLRDTLAEEEKKLIHFREVTVKEVSEQINSKIKERDILEAENEVHRKTRAKLLKPLDEEWMIVKQEKEQIDLEKKKIESNKKQIAIYEQVVDNHLRELSIEYKRQSDTKEQIQKQAEQSSKILLEAQKRLSDALDEEKRVSLNVRNKMRKLSEKEAILLATVNDISLRERKIREEQEEIISENIRLADQRATLERAMARINK